MAMCSIYLRYSLNDRHKQELESKLIVNINRIRFM